MAIFTVLPVKMLKSDWNVNEISLSRREKSHGHREKGHNHHENISRHEKRLVVMSEKYFTP